MIACPDCDALQEEPRRLPRGSTMQCWRCGNVLRRGAGRSVNAIFALVVTATLLFLFANFFPLVSLEARGNGVTTTLFGACVHMWSQDLQLVAVLVFLTTIVAPAFDLASMLYLLLGVMRHDAGDAVAMPPGSGTLLRIVQKVSPWAMLEVFMLGALVSIVKLGQMAAVVPGVALYSVGALILVLAAINASFDPREVWSRLPVRQSDERVGTPA